MGEIQMHLTGLDLLFWAAGFAAHLILLLVLLIRQRVKTFPVFTLFVTLNVARTIALFFIQRYSSRSVYFYTFWALAIIDVGLQLGVVYEMASRIFRPGGHWAIDARRGMVGWAVGSIAVAAGFASLPRPQAKIWEQVVMIRGNLFSDALLSELFVGMIVLSAQSGLPWKTHVARITQGLGVYSLATVAIEMARTYFGLKSGTTVYDELTRVRMGIYLVCVTYWIVMLWRQAPPARGMSERMRREISSLNDAARRGAELLRPRGIQ
jgi:hypothetical protein